MSNRSGNFYTFGLALLLVTSTWLFVPQLANAFAIKTHIVILGLLALSFIRVATHGLETLSFARSTATAGLLLLALAATLSLLFVDNSELAARAWLEVLVLTLLVLGLLNLRHIEPAQHQLETALLVAASGVALVSLKQFFFPAFLDPGFHALGKMKIYSTLGNPNLAALILLPAVPVTLFRVWRAKNRARLGYAALAAVILAGLLATQSRHALLAMAMMAIVATFWLAPLRARRLLLAVLGVGFVAGIALLMFVDIPPTLLHSIKGRWFIWNTAAQMLWQHPVFGVGLGHFGFFHPDFQAQLFATGQFNDYFDNAALIEEAHNQFLHWGATAGFAGLLGFAVLCAALLWKGWHSTAVRVEAPQLYLALCGFLVAMLFVATLAYTAVALVFWLVLALVWRRIETPAPPPAFATILRPLALAAVVGLLLFAGFMAVRDVRAGYHEAQGDLRMEERDLWNAMRAYQAGLSVCPACTSLHKKQATALYLAGQPENALLALHAARRGSGDVALRILEGEILTRLHRLDEAEQLYRRISATFPKMVTPRFILAQIRVLQGRHDEARQEFRAILEIEPSPHNLNLTSEKVELQKDIARQYLREHGVPIKKP